MRGAVHIWGDGLALVTPLRDNVCLKMPSIVPSKLDFTTVFPAEDDPFVIDDDEPAGNEPGMNEFFFGNLAFTLEGSQTGAPGRGARRNVIVAGNLYRLQLIAFLIDADYLVEMPGVMTDPLAC